MKELDEAKLYQLQEYIKKYQAEKGLSPSYRTIMKALNFKGLATVHRYINCLESKGLIEKNDIGGIKIPNNLRKGETIIAPLVGKVACGEPIFAEQNIQENFSLPTSIFGNRPLICLAAQGDSMIGVGIFDGDLVFAEPTNTAENGEIVVALIDNEATIKRYYKGKDKIILRPENPSYKDIVVEDCKIQGRVKKVVHNI